MEIQKFGNYTHIRIKVDVPLPPDWETMPIARGCVPPWHEVEHLFSSDKPPRPPANHGKTPQQMEEEWKRYAAEIGEPWPLPDLPPEDE